jgi:hypothetical protein
MRNAAPFEVLTCLPGVNGIRAGERDPQGSYKELAKDIERGQIPQ